jgi:hypothetical protein
MKADVKVAWLAKLKSGEFAQGSGQLCTWDADKKVWRYCCLGILCEMSGLSEWEEGPRTSVYFDTTYLGSRHYLPVEVAEWAGIDPDCGNVLGIQRSLGLLNDSGMSFIAIADAIDTDPSL